MSLVISIAKESDVATLYRLTVALAEYERKTPEQILVTEQKLKKWAFGPNKAFEAIIAYWEGKPVGMAAYFSVWVGFAGETALYLEDLFVLPEYRGRGIGTKLMQELANKAKERECYQMRWSVFDWNETAIEFYKKLGAEVRQDLLSVRLDNANFAFLLKD